MALGLSALGGSARAAETYSGQDFRTLARSTVGVMRAHQWVLRAQMDRGQVPFFANGIYRGMRAKLEMPNGATVPGLVTRAGAENWGGSGDVARDFGLFYGLQLDALLAEPDRGSDQHMVADGLAFIGAGYHGFEASVGLRTTWTRGFTPSGNFGGGDATRAGTPPAYAFDGGKTKDRFALTGVTISTYHKEGVTLGAALGQALVQSSDGAVSPETVLASARALFQPEALMKRLDLRKWLGIPGVGLERIAGQVDFYGDRYLAVRDRAAAVARGAAAVPNVIPAREAAIYEIPTSIDDLLSLGVHLGAVTQVAPTPLLRSGEIGWMWANDTLQLGARGAVVRRGAEYGGAYDAFAGVALQDFMLVGSLSYNSPDPSTSLPVPFARVIGLQLFWGPADMARPLVPMLGVRKPKLDRERSGT